MRMMMRVWRNAKMIKIKKLINKNKKLIKSIYAKEWQKYKVKSLKLLFMVKNLNFIPLLTSFDLFLAYYLNSQKRMWIFVLNYLKIAPIIFFPIFRILKSKNRKMFKKRRKR
jgi:hypothetical protein